MATNEGFSWTPKTGLNPGLPSLAAISPPQFKLPSSNEVIDAIVIGAGYTGLVAARDLATQGKRTLLIEARDRIGGRTYNGVIDGFCYEMGGTWIHWHMPHVYREISLYQMHDQLIQTQVPGGKHDYFTLRTDRHKVNFSHEDEEKMFSRVWGAFCNVDGVQATAAIPYPFDSMQNKKDMAKWDRLSCQDRLDQIRGQLTDDETRMLEALLLQMGGGPLERMGLLDAIRWWSLGGWTGTGLNDIGLRYRLRYGQSSLARNIFDHAVSSGRLGYSFSSPISSIKEEGGLVTVTSRAGNVWTARHVVCTVPLNVLADLNFSPPLPEQKIQASREGSTNHCNKFHIDVAGPDLVSWASFASPGKGAICALSDRLTPAGDTHLVAFGPSPNTPTGIHLENNINGIKESIEHVVPEGQVIKRIVYHDWDKDEFAKGTWCYFPPNFATRYLDILRQPHGKVLFYNADWSDGWRGWIDGAVEQGTQAALKVVSALQKDEQSRTSHL